MATPHPVIVGIPDSLRQWFKPEAVEHLRCTQVSDHEFRVEIIQSVAATVPGPLGMLGFARQFQDGVAPETDEVMRELRAGDSE